MHSPALPEATRRLVHTRKIECHGYVRADGMMEVESVMRDISVAGSDLFFKTLAPGEDLHHMQITLTLDRSLVIHQVQVRTLAAPTPWCAEANGVYDGLVGLQIGPGFTKKVRELAGGTKGCTHLTELMGPVATTAFQTWHALARETGSARAARALPGLLPRPALFNTCQAYRADAKALEAIWPLDRRAPSAADQG